MEAVPNVTKTNVPGKQTIRIQKLFRINLTKEFCKKFSDKNVPYFATTALFFFPIVTSILFTFSQLTIYLKLLTI